MALARKELDQDTQSRIVEAAGQTFADKGFELATVREICQRAKANVAAVNYYFRDKRMLYLAAIRRAHEQALEFAPLPRLADEATDEERLYAFVHALLQRLLGRHDSWHTQLILRELVAPSEATVELIGQFIRPQFQFAFELVGRLAPQLTTAQRQRAVFSIVGQCVHYRVAQPIIALLVGPAEHRQMTCESLARHITNFSLQALRMPPAQPGGGG